MLFLQFKLSLLLLIGSLVSLGKTKPSNNVCNSFQDYSHAQTSKNCSYNPDTLFETAQLIKKYSGAPAESYKITTDDGYILTLFRIPRKNSRGTILLQHPLSVNSRVWVSQGNDSFAFFLWRAGYDIWLNNARGTLHSDAHKNISSKNIRFWDYSYHEIGKYDIPSQIRFIKEKAGVSKISYVGQSMGVTSGLIYASLHSEDAKNSVKTFVFMATPCYFKYSTSILKGLVPLEEVFSTLGSSLRLGNMAGILPILPISRLLFRAFPMFLMVLNVVTCLGCGWTPDEVDPALFNFDVANNIKGFSFKTLMHYLQFMKLETRFQMFDYGKINNLKFYQSEEPPAYPIENISVPIMFVSSYNDTLTTLQDTDLLIERLPKKIVKSHLKFYGLNHGDFFLGKHRKELYYAEVLNHLNYYNAAEKNNNI